MLKLERLGGGGVPQESALGPEELVVVVVAASGLPGAGGRSRSVRASMTWQCSCWIVASRLRFVSMRPAAGEKPG